MTLFTALKIPVSIYVMKSLILLLRVKGEKAARYLHSVQS